MTVDKVTIDSRFGDQLTVEEYEEKERGDLIAQEIKELYPRISGEFARTLHRGFKAKWHDPITKAMSGRYLSSEEIRKENDEMAAMTTQIRKAILLNMMKNAGSWMTPKQLAKGTGLDMNSVGQRGSLSSALSQLYPFLSECGNLTRRADPGSRGFVYNYSEEAGRSPEESIDLVFKDFQVYEKERMRVKRAEARGEDPKKKAAETTPIETDPIMNPTNHTAEPVPIQGQIENMLTLSQNGDGLKVNIEVNFNIRFGLIKD